MNMDIVIQPIYLFSAALFILSLMWMSHPSTARRGIVSGVAAMLAAVGGTLLLPEIHSYTWIASAIVIGCILGVPLAMVPLTAVPQRTALSHAFGGLAAGLVGASEYYLSVKGLLHEPLTEFGIGALVAEVILGLLDLHGQFDGGRQAHGNHPHAADHLQRPKRHQPLAAGHCDFGSARCW